MIEEPYRWLEAIGNRREYIREQIRGGSPAFGARLPEGILLLGVGSGNSKVFELFDRHALAALGHPADIEKIRQAAIDAAHTEAFTRAPEDVSLRRLVGFGLSPQLKTSFEQIFSAPFLLELLLVELGNSPAEDLLLRLRFDGAFEIQNGPASVVSANPDLESPAKEWLDGQLAKQPNRKETIELLLQAWWVLTQNKSFGPELPSEEERKRGWREAVQGKTVELGWLERKLPRAAKYVPLTMEEAGF